MKLMSINFFLIYQGVTMEPISYSPFRVISDKVEQILDRKRTLSKKPKKEHISAIFTALDAVSHQPNYTLSLDTLLDRMRILESIPQEEQDLTPKRKTLTQITTIGAVNFYDGNMAVIILHAKNNLIERYKQQLNAIPAHEFHAAVHQGNIERIIQCIQSDAGVVDVPCEGKTALQYELRKSSPNLQIIKMLIKARAYVNIELPGFGTPLLWALTNKHYDIALDLIDRISHSPFYVNHDNQTALSLAISQGLTEVVTALINKGARVELEDLLKAIPLGNKAIRQILTQHLIKSKPTSTLLKAMELGDKMAIRILFEALIKTEAKIDSYFSSHDIQVILNYVISNNDEENINYLVKSGFLNLSLIEKVISLGHKELAQTLLLTLIKTGKNFSSEHNDLKKCFLSAISKNYKEIVQTLLQSEAIVDVQVLLEAIESGNEEIRQILSEAYHKRGATVLLQDFIKAFTSNREEGLAGVLIQTKREMDLKMYGYSTFSNLTSADCKGIVHALIKEGATLNVENLREAFIYGCKDLASVLAEALVEAGADLNVTLRHDETFLRFTIIRDWDEIALYLINNINFDMRATWKLAQKHKKFDIIAGLDKKRQNPNSKNGLKACLSLMHKKILNQFLEPKSLTALVKANHTGYALASEEMPRIIQEKQKEREKIWEAEFEKRRIAFEKKICREKEERRLEQERQERQEIKQRQEKEKIKKEAEQVRKNQKNPATSSDRYKSKSNACSYHFSSDDNDWWMSKSSSEDIRSRERDAPIPGMDMSLPFSSDTSSYTSPDTSS